MKRFTRIVALILALVTVFMVFVSADDFSNDVFINILDYGTSDNGSNYILTTKAGIFEFAYTLPFRTSFSYVDIVINIVAGAVPDISVIRGSNIYALTRVSLGNNMYRYFGSVRYDTYSTLSLQYTVTADTYFVITKFDALTSRSNYFAETGLMVVGDSPSYIMSSSSDIVTHYWGTGVYGSSVVHFSCPDWKLYDYVTFFIYGYDFDVNSVSARFGSFPLDCSVSYLDSTNSFSSYSRWGTMVTVDLTGLNRTKTDVPQIEVTGNFGNSEYQSYIGLISVTGFVSTNDFDSYNYWLRNIYASINAGFDDLASRQAAYQQDLQTWQQQHHQVISGLLQGISNGLTSMTNTLKDSIDSAGIYIVDSISSFRSSMESYLEELPVRIAEEISKIFKPSEGKFEAAKDESQELAEEKLGAVYQSAIVIDQIAGAFTNQSPQTSIAIPLVSVEVLPGVPFAFGGWDVPVVPSGLEFFVETLKFVIDIVCTLAFLNGMKRRLDGLFGGESGAD